MVQRMKKSTLQVFPTTSLNTQLTLVRSCARDRQFDSDSDSDSEEGSLSQEDIDIDGAQYVTIVEAEAASEAHNRLASSIMFGDEILD